MTDHNEERRQQDYAETQTQCRALLGSIYLALVDHEARAKDWGANGTLLSVKCSLGQIIEVLTQEPGAKEIEAALNGIAETVEEVYGEAQQIEEAVKRA